MTGFVVGVLVGAVLLAVALWGRQAWAWWQRRRAARDWCDECQRPLREREVHTLAAVDEVAVDGVLGGTAVSADYCAAHCPGGCHRGCEAV